MYKVYNFNTENEKKEFEKKYIALISTKARGTTIIVNSKETNYLDFLNNIISDVYNEYCNKISCFPKNFEELLILNSKSLSYIYCQYISNKDFSDCINSKLIKIRRKYKEIKTQKQKISEEKIIFDYDFFYKEIVKGIMNNEFNIFNINTCFYCNMTYINTYTVGKQRKYQFDLDHFIPKSKFPIIALCLYNFVPSCHICNSRIKLAEEYYEKCTADEINKLMPTNEKYSYDESLKFRVIPNKPIFEDNKIFSEFKDKKECFNIEFEHCDNYSDLYEKEAEGFDIIKRYDYHKREFLAHIDKKRKYPPSYFFLLAQNKSLTDTSDLQEAIFNTNLRNEEKMIFQKIYNDIDENL